MPFFSPLTPDESNTTPLPEDFARAAKLRKAVTASVLMIRPWRSSQWADEFRILRQQLKKVEKPGELIDSVLEFYCKNVGRNDLPSIQSARAFRKTFEWLVRLSAKLPPVTRTLLPEQKAYAKELYGRLRRKAWGPGELKLEESIEHSVYNHGETIKLLAPLKNGTVMAPFVIWMWPRFTGTSFMLNWYENIWQRVKDWTGWSGTFKSFEFKMNSEHFHKIGVQWAAEFGSKGFWSELVKKFPTQFQVKTK